MIKVENIDVWGFEHAVRGMRNPMNSWDKSDSFICENRKDCTGCPVNDSSEVFGCNRPDYTEYVIGKNDLDLMRRLYKAGTEHRKYLRQIFVSMDITAPHYWWYDFDTYKIGVVRNSCSKNHKLMSKPFELNDFSHEHLIGGAEDVLQIIIDSLNNYRNLYLKTKDKDYWWLVTQLLPLSYNHRATITMNYENVVSIIKQRDNHILDEFKDFVEILKGLPYVQEIMN